MFIRQVAFLLIDQLTFIWVPQLTPYNFSWPTALLEDLSRTLFVSLFDGLSCCLRRTTKM